MLDEIYNVQCASDEELFRDFCDGLVSPQEHRRFPEMRYNNLKIYCQTQEDQSDGFDFLFEIYRNDIKY